MTRSEPAKTPLEWLLHLWTAGNVLVAAWVMAPLPFNPQLRESGHLLFAVLVMAVAIASGALLVWKLFKPTVAVMIYGTVFWALQIFSLKKPDAIYLFRLGLSIDFRLTSDPDFIVAVNVLGVMLTLMFGMALKDRLDARDTAAAKQGKT
jgi:hypothetical protein